MRGRAGNWNSQELIVNEAAAGLLIAGAGDVGVGLLLEEAEGVRDFTTSQLPSNSRISEQAHLLRAS